MRTALAVILPFIGVPPICLGMCGICMGAVVEPPGGRILIGMGSMVIPSSVLACTSRYTQHCGMSKIKSRGGRVFYLFRPGGGVNGIPLPSSAQYRLWIPPKSRRLAGLPVVPKPQVGGQHQPKLP